MNLPKPDIGRDEAIEMWLNERSEYAKEQVVSGNVMLVGHVLKSLGLNVFDDDLFATGIVGVVKAVNTFDPNRGGASFVRMQLR